MVTELNNNIIIFVF